MYNKSPNYKIRQVIDLTGASEFLLRTWENRYAALKPSRTKTGRRLYSESDILKVRALLSLTQLGYRVGEIANMSLHELNKLLLIDNTKIAPPANSTVKKVIDLVSSFNWPEAREVILREKRNTEPMSWIHNLIVPLLAELGRQVENGLFSIAQEHILSAIIKESLAFHLKAKSPLKNAPRIVFAAPEGDFHDIGITIASFIATELRANSLFLGPHMPKSELVTVCIRYKATHLLLSSTNVQKNKTNNDLLKYLNFLDRHLDSKISIWLAGKNAEKYVLSLGRTFKITESFTDFENEVKKCLN